MVDFAKWLGRMVILSIILPGIIGYIAIIILFSNTLFIADISKLKLSLLIFFIGFVANAIGYFFDICLQIIANRVDCIFSCLKDPYFDLINILLKKDDQIIERMKKDFDYLYCESTWYLNSSIILLLIVILTWVGKTFYKQIFSVSQYYVALNIFFLLLAVILLVLYVFTRQRMWDLLSKMKGEDCKK